MRDVQTMSLTSEKTRHTMYTVRASQYSGQKVGKRCVTSAQSLHRSSYPPTRFWDVLSTMIIRMSKEPLACVLKALTTETPVHSEGSSWSPVAAARKACEQRKRVRSEMTLSAE